MQIVANAGLRGLTFRAVGTRAGVNNTLIAHYFGNREKLIEVTLEWAVGRSIDSTDLRSFATSHEEFVTRLSEVLAEESELQAFQYEMILEARRRAELREPVRRLYEKYEDEIAKSLVSLGVADIDASTRRAYFGAVDGLALQRISGNITIEEFESALRRVLEFTTAGRTA